MIFKITQHKIFAGLCILLIITSLISVSPKIKKIVVKEQGTKLPIIVYHNIVDSPKKLNENSITYEMLEEDLLYIKQKGYTTISMTQLINHCLKGDMLPDKPIILCFDDGFKSVYTQAFPLLEQNNMCATISVVGIYADHSTQKESSDFDFSYMNWNDIEKISKSSLIEIQNHSYDMHNKTGNRIGTRKKANESDEQYCLAIKEDISKLQNLLFDKIGIKPNTFVYTFNSNSKLSKKVLKELGFNATLTNNKKVNTLNSSIDLFSLGRFHRTNDRTTEQFFENILE